MNRQDRGPYILAAGAGVQLLTGIPSAWGVFQRPVMQGYGLSRGQAMLAFALLVAAYGVGCAAGGLLQDRRGPRRAGLWGTALLAGAFLAAALAPPGNAVLFLLVYSLPAGLGSAFLAPAVLACAQKWYRDRKGWATGVTGVAMGLSGAFFYAVRPGRGRTLGHPRLFCGAGAAHAAGLRRRGGSFAGPARLQPGGAPGAGAGLPADAAHPAVQTLRGGGGAQRAAGAAVQPRDPGHRRRPRPAGTGGAFLRGTGVGGQRRRAAAVPGGQRYVRAANRCCTPSIWVWPPGRRGLPLQAAGGCWASYALLTFFYSGGAAVQPAWNTDLFGLRHAGVNYGFLALGMSGGSLLSYIGSQALPLGARHWLAGGCALAGLLCAVLVKPLPKP